MLGKGRGDCLYFVNIVELCLLLEIGLFRNYFFFIVYEYERNLYM